MSDIRGPFIIGDNYDNSLSNLRFHCFTFAWQYTPLLPAPTPQATGCMFWLRNRSSVVLFRLICIK